jgi:hypothetical protein
MNMMIDLPPEIETRLRGAAARSGMEVGAYAAKLIVEHVPAPHEVDDSTDNEDFRPPHGFVPVQLERKSLFTQKAAGECKDLPKWKPHVDLSCHLRSEVDDG